MGRQCTTLQNNSLPQWAVDYQLTEFDSFSMVLESREVKERRQRVDSVATSTLLASDDLVHRAELQWRIALPISIS